MDRRAEREKRGKDRFFKTERKWIENLDRVDRESSEEIATTVPRRGKGQTQRRHDTFSAMSESGQEW